MLHYPHVKQQEKIDCGAACLSMICQFYGFKGTLGSFRELVKTDSNGTSIYGMVDGGRKKGFYSEALNGTLDSLMDSIKKNEIKCPFVARVLNDGYTHYVVVYKLCSRGVIVGDPATKIVRQTIDEFEAGWTGYVVTFEVTDKFKKGNDRKKSLSYLRETLTSNNRYIVFTIVLSAIVSIVSMLGAFVFEYIVDGLYDEASNTQLVNAAGMQSKIMKQVIEMFPEFGMVFLALIGLYVFQYIIQLYRDFILIRMSKKINLPLLSTYYEHVMKLPMSFWDTRKTGDIMSRFFEPVTASQGLVSVIFTIFIDGLLAVLYGVYMFSISKTLFLISIAVIAAYTLVIFIFKQPLASMTMKNLQKNSEVNSYLKETIDGIYTVKTFSAENRIVGKGKELFAELIECGQKRSMLSTFQVNITGLIGSAGVIVLLWSGIYLIQQNVITSGTLITFYVMLGNFLTPVQNLVGLQSQIQNIFLMSERIYDVISIDIEDNNGNDERLMGDISIKNVFFRYGNRKLVLEDCSIEIKKGKKIAIVGESGCGKTTLIKLILGIYPVEHGSICIGKKNIADISKQCLRHRIAYVSQSIYLFSDTLKNNLLLFGASDASEEEIMDVLRKCELQSLLDKMPFGLDSMLEEQGENLSGGEKQKIAIARALLKKPDILILDEATSNLDTITETKIVRMLETLTKDMTVITIAHRLSTIKRYDVIFSMKNGKIEGFGRYDQMQEQNKLFINNE